MLSASEMVRMDSVAGTWDVPTTSNSIPTVLAGCVPDFRQPSQRLRLFRQDRPDKGHDCPKT
jgi:hypothetical protein